MVHQRVERSAGIVLDYILHAFAQIFGIRRADKVNNRVCKRVVHHAVQLAALKVSAAVAVAYLIGRVLPDLAVDERVFFLFSDCVVEAVEKFVGQLVCDVEPPARCAEAEPVPRNAVSACQEIQHAGIGLVEFRQNVNAPPAGVIVRPASKIIPRTVGRIFVAICALAAVS